MIQKRNKYRLFLNHNKNVIRQKNSISIDPFFAVIKAVAEVENNQEH